MDSLGEWLADGRVAALGGATLVVVVMGFITRAILTSQRLGGSSLFNRLFIVVAVTSAFFSAISSAIGFGLITSQESDDLFRNSILPPAFGVFVFFLAVAIWVGGAELVRNRDWFRKIGRGVVATILQFLERALKLFVLIPIMATILFFISTWTTVVGIGGVDAVRHTYNYELGRLQADCAGIAAYRQKDFLFREDLRFAIGNARRSADREERGAQSGSAGLGPVTGYINGVEAWLTELEKSVTALIGDEDPTVEDPSGANPYETGACSSKINALKEHLSSNAFENYDLWARQFETDFDDFVAVLNRWRHDRRIEQLMDQQVNAFASANPKPASTGGAAQTRAINQYAEDVESDLKTLVRKQKLAKPPIPLPSAAELSPARGIEMFREWFEPAPGDELTASESGEEQRVSRTAAIVATEFLPGLSTISPRDAVLKNANIFSDIWALAISWDYASYILLLVFLFFPSAERAAGFKDQD